MRRAGGGAGSLVGFGLIAVAGTVAWHGVKNAGVAIQAQRELQKLRKALAVSSTTSKCITDSMLRQMFRGLEGDTENSTLLMLPSWLPSLPSGKESGSVLAVDFGGTSFRVMQVVLGTDAGDVKLMSSTEIDIPSAIYSASVADLYDFIAAQVVAFARDRGIAPSATGSDASATTSDPASAPTATPPSAGLSSAPPSATAAAADPRPTDPPLAGLNGAPSAPEASDAAAATQLADAGGSDAAPGTGAAAAEDLGEWADVEADRDGGAAEAQDGTLFPPLGFCFSFPMVQTGLTTGKLVRWTKGFDIPDGIGSDPAASLTRALRDHGWAGGVAALLNDGIGIFGAGRYHHPRAAVSMILGTGTNAAYVEKIANIPSMAAAAAGADAETVVNTEWGAFAFEGVPRCAADVALDAASVRPGAQPFEKLVSGMYLPEIVRRAFLTVVKAAGVLTPATWGRLAVADALTGPQMAAADADETVSQGGTAAVLMHALGMRRAHCTLLTCWTLKQVIDAVAERAARVLAAGLTALLLKVGAPQRGGTFAVAVDGSVYHKYHKFRRRLHGALAAALAAHGGVLEDSDAPPAVLEAVRPRTVLFQVQCVGCEGGSCFGAAVIAASQASSLVDA